LGTDCRGYICKIVRIRGTCKMRNETRNEIYRNETKPNETKFTETKRTLNYSGKPLNHLK
jgi:hypothetical protein